MRRCKVDLAVRKVGAVVTRFVRGSRTSVAVGRAWVRHSDDVFIRQRYAYRLNWSVRWTAYAKLIREGCIPRANLRARKLGGFAIGLQRSNKGERVERYFGSLLPFALKFSPSGVSAPPPAGLVWQSPQLFPVSLANCGVAAAGRARSKEAALTSANMVAMLHARTSVIFAFTFIVGLSSGDEG